MTAVERVRRDERRETVRLAIAICESMLHNVPAEGGDELDRIGRYSNGTVERIIARLKSIGMLKRPTSASPPPRPRRSPRQPAGRGRQRPRPT